MYILKSYNQYSGQWIPLFYFKDFRQLEAFMDKAGLFSHPNLCEHYKISDIRSYSSLSKKGKEYLINKIRSLIKDESVLCDVKQDSDLPF